MENQYAWVNLVFDPFYGAIARGIIQVFLGNTLKYKIWNHGAWLSPVSIVYCILVGIGQIDHVLTAPTIFGFFFVEHLAAIGITHEKSKSKKKEKKA